MSLGGSYDRNSLEQYRQEAIKRERAREERSRARAAVRAADRLPALHTDAGSVAARVLVGSAARAGGGGAYGGNRGLVAPSAVGPSAGAPPPSAYNPAARVARWQDQQGRQPDRYGRSSSGSSYAPGSAHSSQAAAYGSAAAAARYSSHGSSTAGGTSNSSYGSSSGYPGRDSYTSRDPYSRSRGSVDARSYHSPARLAFGETVILLHPPLPSAGVSMWMARERQQNDRTLADL